LRYTVGLGRYFGIPLRVHATFPLVLVVYAVDAGRGGDLKAALAAAALVLCVFACVVLHELGHSLAMRRYGIRVRDIILFPIGGVARAESIPANPRHEIVVAIAGPAVNFAIALILYTVLFLRHRPLLGDDFLASAAFVNLALGCFNLIPGYPMDGGRILRGALATRMPYVEATRRARDVGQLVALAFLGLAFVDIAFIMLAVIAVFVIAGGMMEERMVSARVRLNGRNVGDVVDFAAPVFSASDPVERAAESAFAPGAGAFAIAAESGSLAGVVITSDVLSAVRDGRQRDPLATLARHDFPVADATTDATRVFRYLRETRKPFAAVVDGDRFVGLFHADETLRDFPRGVTIP